MFALVTVPPCQATVSLVAFPYNSNMASTKHQWKGSVEKARRQSRELPTNLSPKGSVIGEETSAKELAEYLETLKKKSGIKSLWRGESFDRAVRDDEDKTPDISISSIDEDEFGRLSILFVQLQNSGPPYAN